MWATLRQRKWLSCCSKNSSNHVSTCLGECDGTFSFVPLPEFILDHKIFNTVILKFKHKYKNLLVIYCVQVNRATQGNGSLDSFNFLPAQVRQDDCSLGAFIIVRETSLNRNILDRSMCWRVTEVLLGLDGLLRESLQDNVGKL